MSFNKLFLLILLSSVLLFSRNTVGLNINTEDLELTGEMDVNTFSEYTNGTMFVVNANYLNTIDDNLFGLGLSANNSYQGAEGLSLGFGAKFIYLENFMAFPLMAEATYAFMLMDNIPMASLSANILYAPTALSFDEANNYFEFRAEAAMEVINAVSLYVGYRDIETEYIDFDFETFNSSFYGGLKMSF